MPELTRVPMRHFSVKLECELASKLPDPFDALLLTFGVFALIGTPGTHFLMHKDSIRKF